METLENVFAEEHPLSNCCPVNVEYDGTMWPSVEHAYQVQKFIWAAGDVVRVLYEAEILDLAYEVAVDLDLSLGREEVESVWNAADEQTALHIASSFDLETNRTVIREIFNANSGPEASRLAGQHARLVRPGWEEEKVNVIYSVMEQKFLQNNRREGYTIGVGDELLATGDAVLYEEAYDDEFASGFWGCDADGNGLNVIGAILMDIRETLRAQSLQ